MTEGKKNKACFEAGRVTNSAVFLSFPTNKAYSQNRLV